MSYTAPAKINIRNVKDIHSELSKVVKDEKLIEINLDDCEDVDLSLIQLIESARKTAASTGKDIKLAKPANDVVQTALKRAGLTESFTSDDTKFWLHKEVL